ncbi:MAG: aminodeoxychorismate lyase [Methylococcales bacterium]|nr:aminodeoxychorismate lyase [Methylococcales bacterium]
MMLVNGQPQTQINVADRGFQYGDGLFETIEILNSQLVFFEQHLQRLIQGCERLLFPPLDRQRITEEALHSAKNCSHGILKIIITRGTGGRGYQQPQTIIPTRVLSRHPFPDYPDSFQKQGINVKLCQQRLALNPTLAGLKHLNRLEQVLARAEWSDLAIQEGLMRDLNGHVIEGTMSNIFFVTDNKLYTPSLEQAGIAGIMRGFVLEKAATLGIECQQGIVTLQTLLAADEIFMTNSIIGIWAVNQLDAHVFHKGPLTQQLHALLTQHKQQFL